MTEAGQEGEPLSAVRKALIALAYAVFALSFVWLATPPGVAAPFWPASGIAVACVWVYGRGAVVPVFFGALVANLLVLGPSVSGLIGALGIATAAGSEAFLAWWALRKTDGTPLQYARHVVGVALIAPFLPALIGPLAIFVAFGLGVDRLAFEFVSWWAGDAMGILIAGPIALGVLLRADGNRGSSPAFIVPILLLGAVLSMNFAAVRGVADRELEAASTERARAAGLTIKLGLARIAELTFNLSSYFDASEVVTPEEFELYTVPPLDRIVGVESLIWFELESGEQGESVRVAQAQPPNFDLPAGNLLADDEFAELFSPRLENHMLAAPISENEDLLLALVWTPRGQRAGWAGARIRVSEFLPEVFHGRVPEGLALRMVNEDSGPIPLGHSVPFGDQEFELSFDSPPLGASARRDRDLLVNYIAGVLFAAATVLFLLVIAAHNEQLAAETASRRIAERRLEKTATELARSNQDLEEFAAGASHDLRAPLRAITGLTGLVLEDERGTMGDESVKMLELVQSRANRLEMMIRGLLEYARVGRGDEPQPILLDELVREAVDIAVVPAKFDVEVEVPRRFVARRAALLAVLTNVIANAVRHHDRDAGTIRVSAARATGALIWKVADDGPGIPDADRDRVFKVFTTLKSRDERESTGMGLATVRRLVLREGGEIQCLSANPRGAVVQFTWPSEPKVQV